MSDIKSYIDKQLSDFIVSSELSSTILNQTTYKNKSKRCSFAARRMVALVAAFCLILTCSLTAFAATIPTFNNLVYMLNPNLAEFLYPINEFVEDKGIQVEVLSAYNDNHNAVVYFTVQDIAGKGRVDEKLDLCDTCDIDGPCAFNIQMLSYDEKTSTALLVMRGSGGEGMSEKMTTFNISTLMSNKTNYDWYHTGIDIASIIDSNTKSWPISKLEFTGGSELPSNDFSVLEPDVMSIPLGDGVDFVIISNIGFVDGKLHIQTKWETSFDNHGQFWLADEKGVVNGEANTISYNNYYFRTAEDSENCYDNRFAKHIEYVFDVSNLEDLSGYNLWADLVEDGTFTEGKWQVNFRMADSDHIDIIEMDGYADSVEVTSIGAYINGYNGNSEDCDLSIVMKDGTEFDYSRFSTSDQSGVNQNKWNISMMFDKPMEMKDVSEISINGAVIYEVQ